MFGAHLPQISIKNRIKTISPLSEVWWKADIDADGSVCQEVGDVGATATVEVPLDRRGVSAAEAEVTRPPNDPIVDCYHSLKRQAKEYGIEVSDSTTHWELYNKITERYPKLSDRLYHLIKSYELTAFSHRHVQ